MGEAPPQEEALRSESALLALARPGFCVWPHLWVQLSPEPEAEPEQELEPELEGKPEHFLKGKEDRGVCLTPQRHKACVTWKEARPARPESLRASGGEDR